MQPMTLQEFLSLLGSHEWAGPEARSVRVSGVSIDTRKLKPGEVYFALQGERFDGHDFLPDAFRKGASAAVVRRSWIQESQPAADWRLIVVDDPLAALQQVAAAYRRRFDIPVLGLTGTNGKTTTKEMAAAVLAKKYRVVKTPGNLNNHIGTPLSLLQLEPDVDVAVIEMGTNHFGEIRRLCEIAAPTHGLITNIGAGHLEFFGSVENVAKAKAELFESLPKEGIAFVNVDDPLVVRIAEKVPNRFTYGFESAADVRGRFLGLNHHALARIEVQGVEIRLGVPGRHQISNALAAAAVGVFWEVPLEQIKGALESYRGYSKRMEVYSWRGATVLLDAYNSNPDSLRAALETLATMARESGGRAFAALGDMLELGDFSEKAHYEAGAEAARLGVAALFVYGDFAGTVCKGYRENGGEECGVFEDKANIARELAQRLRPGDVVLIKGSRGMAMETVWEELHRLQ